MAVQQAGPANGQSYTTEREIIDRARQRVRDSGTENAGSNDMTLVVLGYIADMVRQGHAMSREREAPRSLLGTVLRDGGPWAMVALAVALVVAKQLGLDLSGVFGG